MKYLLAPLASAALFGCATLPSKDMDINALSNDLSHKQVDVVYTQTQMITTFPEDGLDQFDGLFGVALRNLMENPENTLVTPEQVNALPLWQKLLFVHETQAIPERVIAELFQQPNLHLAEQPLALDNGLEAALKKTISQSDAEYIALVENSGIFGPRIFSPYTQYIAYSSEVKLIETASGAVVWQEKCHIGPGEGEGQEVHRDDIFEGEGEQLESAVAFVAKTCAAELKPKLATIGL